MSGPPSTDLTEAGPPFAVGAAMLCITARQRIVGFSLRFFRMPASN